jgi:prepilin-type N-terminal cleavage/methylation domain-containing protein
MAISGPYKTPQRDRNQAAPTAGFTIVEVLFAVAIMAVGFAAIASCLQMSLKKLDTSRKTSLISQVLQDEVERLRLENWTALDELPASANINDSLPAQFANTELADMIADGNLFITRTVQDLAGHDGIKHITVTASWTGADGVSRSRLYQFRYARGGISDYFYGTRN